MSHYQQSRSSGFLDAVADWARRSESRQVSSKNHNPRDGSPDWESTFGMDFSWCAEHHILTPNIGLRFDTDMRETSNRKWGCTCPSSSRVSLSMLKGPVDGSVYNIKSLRDTWQYAYNALKKPTSNGRDRLSSPTFQKQQSDEFIAWIKLWSSVWELANKRRRQMQETSMDGELWSEEEQECLIQHREDALERGAVSRVSVLAYCFTHDDVGDSLPVRQPNRYLNCGICLAPVEETEDTRQRNQLVQLKKQPSEYTKMVEYGIIGHEQVYQAMSQGDKFKTTLEERELKQAQTDTRNRVSRPQPRDNRKRREPDQYEEEENDYSFLFGQNNNNNNTEELKSDDENMAY